MEPTNHNRVAHDGTNYLSTVVRLAQRPRMFFGAVIGFVCLIVYTITMSPDVGAHDVGEWQATAATLGIAHPPGSPAYTLIAHLFTLVPLGLPAVRVTFVSVIVGAAGVVAVYAFILILLDSLPAALISSATLAVASMWWSHASVATPYNAVPSIMAILMVLLLLWSKSGNVRLIWAGALLAGIGLAYHPLTMFFLPVPIAGIFLLGPWRGLLKVKPFLIMLLLFAAGLSIYLYLPIRSASNPAIAYQKIDSLSTMLDFVSASHARETKLRHSFLPGISEVKDRLAEVVYKSYNPSFLIIAFAPGAVLLIPGTWRRLGRSWRWLVLLTAGMILHVFLIFVFSDIYDHYYLPLLFYFAVYTGFSVYLVNIAIDMWISEEQLGSQMRLVAGIFYVSYFLLLAAGVPHAWVFANHGQDRGMRNYIDFVFSQAKPDAVVTASWESYTGLLYAQQIEGQRPDISLSPASSQDQRKVLPGIRAAHPEAQILLSMTFNIYNLNNIRTYGEQHPLSNKALSYQDFYHGDPYPWAAQLYDATTGNPVRI